MTCRSRWALAVAPGETGVSKLKYIAAEKERISSGEGKGRVSWDYRGG